MGVNRIEFPVLEISQLRKLKFRELAFISLRAMVRCELILANLYNRSLPNDHRELFDRLKNLLVDVIKSPSSISKASEILPWDMLATFNSALESLPAGSLERTCFLGGVYASRVLPGKVSDVIGWSLSMGKGIQTDKVNEQFRVEMTWAAFDDLKRVEKITADGGFELNPNLADNPLSGIWPESEPDWDFYNQHVDLEIQ